MKKSNSEFLRKWIDDLRKECIKFSIIKSNNETQLKIHTQRFPSIAGNI